MDGRFIPKRPKFIKCKSDLFLVEYQEKCLESEYSDKKSDQNQTNKYASQMIKKLLFWDLVQLVRPKIPKIIYGLTPNIILNLHLENDVYRNDVFYIDGIFGALETTPRIIFKKGFCDDSKNTVVYSKQKILNYYIFTILPKSFCEETNSVIIYTVCKYKKLSGNILFANNVDREITNFLDQKPIVLVVERYYFDVGEISLIGVHVLSERPDFIYWNQFSSNTFGFLVYRSDIKIIKPNHELYTLPSDHKLYNIIMDQNGKSIFLIDFLNSNHFIITFKEGGFYVGVVYENYEMDFSTQFSEDENVLSISFRTETNLLALGYGVDEQRIDIFKFNNNLNLNRLCCIHLKSQICCLTWINDFQIFASGFKNYQIWYCQEGNYLQVQTCVDLSERNLYILKNPENQTLSLINPVLEKVESYHPMALKPKNQNPEIKI